MSILELQPIRSKSRNALLAERMTAQPAVRFAQFLQQWTADIKALWTSPEPQAVLDIIGPQAAELFIISGKTAMYLESLKPGCTAAAMALVGEFTINPDGTVTIISIPSQAP